jgi:hypothetical protein
VQVERAARRGVNREREDRADGNENEAYPNARVNRSFVRRFDSILT